MRKYLSFILLMLFPVIFAEVVKSQNVFVWDGSASNHSGLEWKAFMENRGYSVTYPAVNSVLPEDYSMYDAIFLHFGYWSSGYHGITESEAMNIYNYGLNGGRIYIEGGDINGYPTTNPGYLIVRQLCGLSGAEDGSTITVNSTTPMAGVSETLTNNMSFNGYNGNNSYMDYFFPDSSEGIFYNNSNCYGISWENNNYRVICLSFEIAGLVNETTGASHKDTLMNRILEFLIPPTYIPRNVSAKLGVEQITLTWSVPKLTEGFQRYRIYFGTSPNPVTQTDSTEYGILNDTSRTYTGLQTGTRYYFRLTTLHDGIESDFSQEVSAKPIPAPRGIIVTTIADTGRGSLRWAIDSANSNPDYDTISFASDLIGSVIYPFSGMPSIISRVFINGDITDDGKPDIELDGNFLAMQNILTLRSSFSVIKGLVLSGTRMTSGAGIRMTDTACHDNRIIGNYIGLRRDGETMNENLHGILIENGAYRNYIGDGTAEGRNIIAGNQIGNLYLNSTHHNEIRGNYFGLSASGMPVMTVINDEACIHLEYSDRNIFGGNNPGDRNIISGSRAYGMYLYRSGYNAIQGNWIGFDVNGNPHRNRYGGIQIQEDCPGIYMENNIIGNSQYEGSPGISVAMSDSAVICGNIIGLAPDGFTTAPNDYGIMMYQANHVSIGDTETHKRNVISGNQGSGIEIQGSIDVRIQNNYIGTGINGDIASGNQSDGIRIYDGSSAIQIGNSDNSGRNIISGNSGSGIYINNSDSGIRNVLIRNNFIGTDVTGEQMIPNIDNGIFVSGSGAPLRIDSIAHNRIANNYGDGVSLDGNAVDSVILYRNSIFQNGGSGILITGNAQGNILPPVISVSFNDTLFGTSDTSAFIQIFSDNADEGRNFLGQTFAGGNGQWNFKLPSGLMPNSYITAVQTAFGRSSSFSNALLTNPDHLAVTHARDDETLGSLRYAIMYANGNPGPDSVAFYIPAGSAIQLSGELPALTDSFTVINGDIDGDGIPDIEIRGSSMNHGFVIYSSDNRLNGLIINGCGSYMGYEGGIYISGTQAYRNQITNCYIGTNAAGNSVRPNGNGIIIQNGASDNTIGSLSSRKTFSERFAGGNVISGNLSSGIVIQDTFSVRNHVLGNLIGTKAAGNDSLPNGKGITLYYTKNNFIGNGSSDGRNVISGNDYQGVAVEYSYQNSIAGNYIGLFADGQSALGNMQSGIYMYYAHDNIIGNGNVISGNGADGISMRFSDYNTITGNQIGLDADGLNAVPNAETGIAIRYGGLGNRIGNGHVSGRNIISGNETGIWFFTEPFMAKQNHNSMEGIRTERGPMNYIQYNTIQGNYIGTDITGTVLIPNATAGISIMESDGAISGNLIGGLNADSGNVIAGHDYGVFINGGDSNQIYSNFIGTDLTGSTNLSNAHGIYMTDGASLNDIRYNRIAYNTSDGIRVSEPGSAGNTIRYNSLYENTLAVAIYNQAQWGIKPPTITVMDKADSTLHGSALPNALVHVYADSSANPQGRIFSGETYADASGLWSLKVSVETGWFFRAIQDSLGNSSELSEPYLPKLGNLSALPGILNFGNVPIGTVSQREIKVYTPNGIVEVGVQALSNGTKFLIDSVSGKTFLYPGDTLLFFISYHPDVMNMDFDTLTVYNSSGENLVVPIQGNAVPPAGNLTVRPLTIHFGERLIGDSASSSVRLIASDGDVVINSLSLRYGTDFRIRTILAYPYTILSGDSVQITLGFNPQSAGERYDTLSIINNSVTGEKRVLLQGTGLSNSAPNTFALKPVGTNNLTNQRAPTFAWEGRGDPNGDVLTYITEVSLGSDFTAVAYRDTTPDTTLAAKMLFDSLGAYYWRVTAYDGRGGSRTSNTGFFRIDAVSAELTMGTFFSGVLRQYTTFNVLSSKPLQTIDGKAILHSAGGEVIDSSLIVFEMESPDNLFYQKSYKLLAAGNLSVSVTGTDSAMNTTTVSKNYNISTIAKDQALAMNSDNGRWQVTAPKRTVEEDGFLMVSELNRETKMLNDQSVITMAKVSDEWMTVCNGLHIQGSEPIRAGQGLMVTLTYEADVISELQARYTDYDERKIGMYAEHNGEWMYIGGEGKNGQVQSKMKQYGMVKLMYNPDHEFLPVKLELAQNYPNPFNPATTIRFGIPQEGKVKLTIYNVLGQKVKELVNDSRNAGYYNVIWNGRSERGNVASSGVYLYRLETSHGVVAKKMVLVK